MYGNQANPNDRKKMLKLQKEPKINPKSVCRFKPFMSGLRPNSEVKGILNLWSTNRVIQLLELSIRSHILKHVCVHLIRNEGEIPLMKLVFFFQDMGYDSVRTKYKLEHYIKQINQRYQLPLGFRDDEGDIRCIYLDHTRV